MKVVNFFTEDCNEIISCSQEETKGLINEVFKLRKENEELSKTIRIQNILINKLERLVK